MGINIPLRVWMHRFSDGRRIGELTPVDDVSWSHEWCDEGSLDVTIHPRNLRTSDGRIVPIDWSTLLRKWAVILVVTRGDIVEAAGPILDRDWDGEKLKLKCGDGWSLWNNRFVLNRLLRAHWVDGDILVDEDNPAPEWHLRVNGKTYTDLIVQIIDESLQWGAAPYTLPTAVTSPANYTREYFCWDFATVLDRIQDLTEVINGPEVWFQPTLDSDDVFRWQLRSGDDIGQHHYRLHTGSRDSRLDIGSLSDKADDMTTQAFGIGGKKDDHTMIVMQKSTPSDGMPVLQTVNKEHSTLGNVDEMRSYLQEDLNRGGEEQESINVSVDSQLPVVPGDRLTITVHDDPWIGTTDYELKVLEIGGGTDATKSLGCRRV